MVTESELTGKNHQPGVAYWHSNFFSNTPVACTAKCISHANSVFSAMTSSCRFLWAPKSLEMSSSCNPPWHHPLVCELPFWSFKVAIWQSPSWFFETRRNCVLYSILIVRQVAVCGTVCQLHGSPTLLHTLFYCLFSSKWDHDLKNEHNVVWKKTWN